MSEVKWYQDERLPLPKQSHKVELPQRGKGSYRRKGRRVEKNVRIPNNFQKEQDG